MEINIKIKEEHEKKVIKEVLGLDSITDVSELIRNEGVCVMNATTHYIRIIQEPNTAKVWFLKDHIEIFINNAVYDSIKNTSKLNIMTQPRKKFVNEGLNYTIICKTKEDFLTAIKALL